MYAVEVSSSGTEAFPGNYRTLDLTLSVSKSSGKMLLGGTVVDRACGQRSLLIVFLLISCIATWDGVTVVLVAAYGAAH